MQGTLQSQGSQCDFSDTRALCTEECDSWSKVGSVSLWIFLCQVTHPAIPTQHCPSWSLVDALQLLSELPAKDKSTNSLVQQ